MGPKDDNSERYRPSLKMTDQEREKIEKAALLTRRTSSKFITKSAIDRADEIINNHNLAGVEEALRS